MNRNLRFVPLYNHFFEGTGSSTSMYHWILCMAVVGQIRHHCKAQLEFLEWTLSSTIQKIRKLACDETCDKHCCVSISGFTYIWRRSDSPCLIKAIVRPVAAMHCLVRYAVYHILWRYWLGMSYWGFSSSPIQNAVFALSSRVKYKWWSQDNYSVVLK